ncbi:MAG: substrate-binding domain-containing protein [Akkermansiaceae bacterium]|jgi:DNA-binding LacI/PurR family transcriptional regulator|nr:substrate-binding domain-containing protein [Akkermansiaceae bacterium]
MKHFRPLTAVEELAAHLVGEIQSGELAGALPGVHRLARDLGVSPRSVVAAVAQLERGGLVRGERRLPVPGATERAFLDELAAHGIPTGAYHLPDWEETPEGFAQRLDDLFNLTPPTALILDEAIFLTVAQQHLARRGILSPEHVSLVCCDADPSFPWYLPGVAHIRWDSAPVVRRIARWVEHVARGVDDRRQSDTRAEFVEGGTIGPARG